jgi:hypothetical protein
MNINDPSAWGAILSYGLLFAFLIIAAIKLFRRKKKASESDSSRNGTSPR